MSASVNALLVALALSASVGPLGRPEGTASVSARVQVTSTVIAPEASLTAPTAEEGQVLALINAARAEHQLPPLSVDPMLVLVARGHSQDMGTRGYFSHWEPDEARRDPTDRYAAVLGHRPTVVVGENLGAYDRPDLAAIHAALMKSEKHRENILDREYTWVGIGVVVRGGGRTWVTEMFRGGAEKAG